MFYNQPQAHRFGTALANDVGSGKWKRIEFAVAWVRRSGTSYLQDPIRRFLSEGGFAQFIVGVDIENTSAEGLHDLLAWQRDGSFETYIHHNESNSTFHPKVYLFRNDEKARLIVGSNNLTESGLFINTEAGLQLDVSIDDQIISDVRTALASWRDPQTGLAKKLDETLLNDLIRQGYVYPERELNKRREVSGKKIRANQRAGAQPLFGSQKYTAPGRSRRSVKGAQLPGTVLLMRVRRASSTARRTQIQIPIRVIHTQFFLRISHLVSAHDGRSHPLVQASARGGLNTIKAEIPEIEPMNDPVLRLERTASAIIYQAFDAGSVLGKPIRQALLNGFSMSPPATLSSIADLDKSTWWRFI